MNVSEQITLEEKNSILFYQGSVECIRLRDEHNYLKSFYNVGNAYEAINMLLFSGITNEESRIRKEKRYVDVVLLDFVPELLHVYCNLYSAICKFTYSDAQDEDIHAYRSDRVATLDFLKAGKLFSFVSSSLAGYRNHDFHNKEGILLLEIQAQRNIEHLDINAVLGADSKYPKEEEILFAPFLSLSMEEMVLDEEEKQYRDMNDEMPKAKYKITLKNTTYAEGDSNTLCSKIQDTYRNILNHNAISNAKDVWISLYKDENLTDAMIKEYQEWKENIQIYLKLRFRQIKEDVLKNRKYDQWINKLKEDIDKFESDTNEHRVKYKRQLKWLNIMLSVCYPLSALAISLSVFSRIEMIAKLVGLLFSALGTILVGIGKSLALDSKWQQRTTTYLHLDELERDMDYEMDWSKEKVEEYIDRFKMIVKEDNSSCAAITSFTADYICPCIKR